MTFGSSSQNKRVPNIVIEGARIGFKNFSGLAGKFNAEGDRNFTVFLEKDIAHTLIADGWNVRWLTPKNPEEEPQAILKVKVAFNRYPPTIWAISDGVKRELKEETVNLLDWAEISRADMTINPYSYEKGGRSGISAYLRTIAVHLVSDPIENKYREYPDSAQKCFMNAEGVWVCED